MPDVNASSWRGFHMEPYQYDIRFTTADKSFMRLVYPEALLRLPVTDLKKQVFPAMCYWEYRDERNRDAIRKTRDEIKSLLYRLHAEWDMVSVTYTCEFRLGDNKKTVSNNAKWLNAVKRSKSAYERMTKIQDAFFETLEKFRLQDYLEEVQS